MWHRKVFLLSWLLLSAMPAMAGVFEERKEQCFDCHGDKGVSTTPETPSLGGQPELFVLYQLVGFRDGQRKFELMNEMMKGMSDDDLRAAADFIAKMPPPPKPDSASDEARMAHGKKLADENRCGVCHNADYIGHDQMPRIAHQREDYLLKALRDYKGDKRFGVGAAMNEVLYPLDDRALADLAYFMAHVP
jgi:cytochrome c553